MFKKKGKNRGWGNRLKSFILVLLWPVFSFCQKSIAESLLNLDAKYPNTKDHDTAYVNARNRIAGSFKESKPDSVLLLLESTFQICRQLDFKEGEMEVLCLKGLVYDQERMYADAIEQYDKALILANKEGNKYWQCKILGGIGFVYTRRGNYLLALPKLYESLKLAEDINDKVLINTALNNIANVYYFRNQIDTAEVFYRRIVAITEQMKDSVGLAVAYNNLGELYYSKKKYKEAIQNIQKALFIATKLRNAEVELSSLVVMGNVYTALDSTGLARDYYEQTIQKSEILGDNLYKSYALLGLAALKKKMGASAEAATLTEKATSLALGIGEVKLVCDGYLQLADIYESMGDGMAAIRNHRLYKLYSDSLNNLETERSAASQEAAYEYSKKELKFQQEAFFQKWLIISAFAAFLTLGVIVLLINRNRKRLNLNNKILQERNNLIEQQKEELEKTLMELKATQNQLIYAEKMASLGELTAGIAHEIQNPLNFVNNFSEVSAELLTEMLDEADHGNVEEMKAIGSDIQQNLEKILFHGKRADGIVKSMLYHSRTSAGKKEPTDLNALCEEYLKLSFHGMRAKDKAFNSNFTTHFDPAIGKVTVIPQDIGRVMLNLFNNAFFATSEPGSHRDEGYKPMVKVETQRVGETIRIMVEDNGHGIPANIREKIFQPFFTTKPTGSGTGLGLSLSYDIITKVHNGKLTVESEEGKFTRFTIELPVGKP